MEITDVPARILGLDACSACVAAKMVHLPHKEGRGRATEYLERVYVEIAGPMHVPSAGGRLYLYVAVDDYTRGSTLGRYSSDRGHLMRSRLSGRLQRMCLESGCAR